MNKPTAQELAKQLGLQPLDREGGMFRRTWQAAREEGGKPLGTAIYFLLTDRSYSHFHRLPSDEVYHFYLGDPVELYLLGPEGQVRRIVLGTDLADSQVPQAVAPAGWWQGSRVIPGGQYALLGTTMCPGYADEDYEHGDAAVLKPQYPRAAEIIDTLTGEPIFV